MNAANIEKMTNIQNARLHLFCAEQSRKQREINGIDAYAREGWNVHFSRSIELLQFELKRAKEKAKEEYFTQGRIDGCSSWESIPIVGLTFGSLEAYGHQHFAYRYHSSDFSASVEDAYVDGYVQGFKECLHDWIKGLKREE